MTTISRGTANLALQGLRNIRCVAEGMTPNQRAYYVSLESVDAAITEIEAASEWAPPAATPAEQLRQDHGEVVAVLGENSRSSTRGGFRATGYRFADGHVEPIR